mmetsp:Transcript_4833/g.6533  ORF Transcript_4833/g.6533 Transcript_4833/m.6533 type:complete len:215 (-) Transcript_4833:678-1322(-)
MCTLPQFSRASAATSWNLAAACWNSGTALSELTAASSAWLHFSRPCWCRSTCDSAGMPSCDRNSSAKSSSQSSNSTTSSPSVSRTNCKWTDGWGSGGVGVAGCLPPNPSPPSPAGPSAFSCACTIDCVTAVSRSCLEVIVCRLDSLSVYLSESWPCSSGNLRRMAARRSEKGSMPGTWTSRVSDPRDTFRFRGCTCFRMGGWAAAGDPTTEAAD